MMSINTTSTVRDLAIAIPGATRIFEQFGIDYCCGGGRSLVDACDRSNVNLERLVSELKTAADKAGSSHNPSEWNKLSLCQLITHIVDAHHVFTRNELVRIGLLLAKVTAKHGTTHPELSEVERIFQELNRELLPHMLKEEQVLFPYINRIEGSISNGSSLEPPFFVTVQNPVRMMMREHDTAGELLAEMQRITNDYAPPPDACLSFRALYVGLWELAADLHQHIHLENNILFPKAIELENQAQPQWEASAEDYKCSGFAH
jgi:iron-sulfur cluster repair di-iron protein